MVSLSLRLAYHLIQLYLIYINIIQNFVKVLHEIGIHHIYEVCPEKV